MSTETALRADARRNRERILEAARVAFAEQGLDAQIDDIAREAGVGVGTVYRHFATKDGLFEAVALGPLGRLREMATAALERDDPGPAFEDFMRAAAGEQTADRCLGETGEGTLAASAAVMAARAELGMAVARLLARAQEAGAVRDDVVMEDLPMLIFGIGATQRLEPCVPRTTWQRHVEIVLDGLRAPAGRPLPPL
jgi:AcrR family transcriptional regulator